MKQAPATSAGSGHRTAGQPGSGLRSLLSAAVVNAQIDPALVIQPPDRLVLSNRAADELLRITGPDTDHLSLSRIETASRAVSLEGARLTLDSWIHCQTPLTLQFEGDTRWFRPMNTMLEEEGLQLVVLRDVTREVKQLEHLQDLRKEFLSAAAHKFNTPLTAIKMYVHLLKMQEERRPEAPMLPHLRSLDHHLNRLSMEVNEVVDLAQMRMGGLTLHPHPMDIIGVIRRILAEFSVHRSDRPITFEPTIPYVVGVWDEARIEQVIRLVVDNADRYSHPESPIAITVDADEKRVRIEIADQGVGIPPEAMSRLYEPYFRAENIHRLRLGTGLGLGLYLCREIIQKHNGTIDVSSELEKGTRVVLTLPKSALA